MGYIFLPKFTQNGQQRYAHGEATVGSPAIRRYCSFPRLLAALFNTRDLAFKGYVAG